MGLPLSDLAAMEVSIAANQIETLHYRIQAEACPGPAAAGAPWVTDAAVNSWQGTQSGVREAAPIPYASSPRWSATVRALRERTLAEVEAQVARFVETTGRNWQVAALDFGEARTIADGAGPEGRIVLVTSVVLRALAPTLH